MIRFQGVRIVVVIHDRKAAGGEQVKKVIIRQVERPGRLSCGQQTGLPKGQYGPFPCGCLPAFQVRFCLQGDRDLNG